MKMKYLIVASLFSSIMFGQTTFNNAGGSGNGKWSTAGNWIGGVLPTANVQLNVNVDLDTDQSISGYLRSTITTLSGVGKLTSTGTVSDNVALLSAGANFTYNGKIEIDNPNIRKALLVNNIPGGAARQLTLGPLSVLTLTTPATVYTGLDSKVVFQGKLEGAANLEFSGVSEFGPTSDNTGFNGDMVFVANGATVTSNTTNTGAFLKSGRRLLVNTTNCSLTLNGANSFNGNLSVASNNAFTLNVNANQESLGTVTVAKGALTINVGSAVANLSFANSSAVSWGSGTVAITGYRVRKIRFGTDGSALTSAQLSKITADGPAAGKTLALNSAGYLVVSSSN